MIPVEDCMIPVGRISQALSNWRNRREFDQDPIVRGSLPEESFPEESFPVHSGNSEENSSPVVQASPISQVSQDSIPDDYREYYRVNTISDMAKLYSANFAEAAHHRNHNTTLDIPISVGASGSIQQFNSQVLDPKPLYSTSCKNHPSHSGLDIKSPVDYWTALGCLQELRDCENNFHNISNWFVRWGRAVGDNWPELLPLAVVLALLNPQQVAVIWSQDHVAKILQPQNVYMPGVESAEQFVRGIIEYFKTYPVVREDDEALFGYLMSKWATLTIGAKLDSEFFHTVMCYCRYTHAMLNILYAPAWREFVVRLMDFLNIPLDNPIG